jgi:FkbM family methyltransferase
MRAAGYVQAPKFQASDPVLGLAPQRARIEQFAADQGWELVQLYEDPPGGRRPALSRLEQELEGYDKVIVDAFDRLRGSVDESLQFVRRLEQAGVGLVCLREAFDTGAQGGRAVAGVLEVVAEWQRLAESRDGGAADVLRKPGLAPATVIDVGVGFGTRNLYEAFPDAYLVLIEPLAEFEPDLTRLVTERPGEYVLAAAGAATGEAQINVRPQLQRSSLLSDARTPAIRPEPRTVPVVALDDLLAERTWTPPFGLKIDTEGYEHRVVEGAQALLEDTQFVLAEVSLAKRFEDSYTFAEFVSSMDELGFRLCDVLHVFRLRRHHDGLFADALFRKND